MIGGVMLAAVVAVPAITVIAAPATASAQDFSTGSMTGTVTDANGAPISGASVQVRSDEQGFSRNLTTDANGGFRAALVPIGNYTVTITAPGYDPISQTASVRLGSSTAYDFSMNAGTGATLGDVVITGARRALAFNETTTGLVVDLEELVKTVPIGRDITSVTLLAPSTVQGDNTFGNLPAVAGSSVAENAFYVNGLNITNFDNYIGGSTVPFDFYRSVEVKTGGYPAEFGRATGGIINAVTKSGSNEFEFAIRGNFSPDSLREQSPDTYQQRNELDESSSSSITLEAGGPIIRDRLFFFALAQFSETEAFNANKVGTAALQQQDDPFYGVKLDGYITDDHRLEFTYFDTTRETETFTAAFNANTDTLGAYPDLPTIGEAGGESYVFRYTGQFTDWLTLSAAYGVNEDRANSLPARLDLAFAQDARGAGKATNPRPAFRVSSRQPAATINVAETKRTFYRADADIFFSMLGEHHVRGGYELEETELFKSSFRTGPYGANLVYRRAVPSTPQVQGPSNLNPGEEYVEFSTFRTDGNFTGENEAYYIQDSWDVNEQLTLNLGVRLDKFSLNDGAGQEFIAFDNEIGPRLGFTFDPMNDGRSRVFGSYGRYYLPVASNTAFRGAANELFFSQYFLLGGYAPLAPGAFGGQTGQTEQVDGNAVVAQVPYNSDGIPLALGAQVQGWTGQDVCPAGLGAPAPAGSLGCRVTGDGTVKDSSSFAAKNLESTAEDEWIIGFERRFGDLWTVTAAVMYRDLLRNAEDVAIDAAVIALCDDEGIVGCGAIYSGFHQYVVLNPGSASTITLLDPLPGEVNRRTVTFSAADLNYPKAERTYTALELSFERAFDGIWSLQGSWVISESTGNTEGYVKSDNGQTDAGITQDFDQPGLTDGSNGLLPNHRGHVFKLFGSYQLMDNLVVGSNVSVSSPRPFGCIGLHPTDQFAQEYGAASNYCGGQLVPRGTAAESDWIKQVDVSLRYTVPENFLPGDLVLRADIFNIFNFEGTSDINEFGEDGAGVPDSNYRAPLSYQTPRFVRLGFDLTF
jgi:outer membrane receptor protein involved in Fe transport